MILRVIPILLLMFTITQAYSQGPSYKTIDLGVNIDSARLLLEDSSRVPLDDGVDLFAIQYIDTSYGTPERYTKFIKGDYYSRVSYYNDSTIGSLTVNNNGLEQSFSFYPTGQFKSTSTYYNKEYVYYNVSYYEDGVISSIEEYHFDSLKLSDLDTISFVYKQFQLPTIHTVTRKVFHVHNVKIGLDGISRHYYPNGQIQWIISYNHDIREGQSLYYSETGELLYEYTFEEGELVEVKDYTEN